MKLIDKDPKYGYYPEPENIILVVHLSNILDAKTFFNALKFKMVTEFQYLGRFIDSALDCDVWIEKKALTWRKDILI